jgi:4-hydroxybenzoate polyprenyltransferase
MPNPIVAVGLVLLGIVIALLLPLWLIVFVAIALVVLWAFFFRGHERRV